MDWRRIAAIASGAGRGMVATQQRDQEQRQQAFQNMLQQRQLGMQQQSLTSQLATQDLSRQRTQQLMGGYMSEEDLINLREKVRQGGATWDEQQALQQAEAQSRRAFGAVLPAEGIFTGREPTMPVQLGRGIGQLTALPTGGALPMGGLAPRAEGVDPWQRYAPSVTPQVPSVQPQLAGTIQAPTSLTPLAAATPGELGRAYVQGGGELESGPEGFALPGALPPTPHETFMDELDVTEKQATINEINARISNLRAKGVIDSAEGQDVLARAGYFAAHPEIKDRYTAATIMGDLVALEEGRALPSKTSMTQYGPSPEGIELERIKQAGQLAVTQEQTRGRMLGYQAWGEAQPGVSGGTPITGVPTVTQPQAHKAQTDYFDTLTGYIAFPDKSFSVLAAQLQGIVAGMGQYASALRDNPDAQELLEQAVQAAKRDGLYDMGPPAPEEQPKERGFWGGLWDLITPGDTAYERQQKAGGAAPLPQAPDRIGGVRRFP